MLDILSLFTKPFLFQLAAILLLLSSFYHYGKKLIFNYSPTLAQKMRIVNQYPFTHVVGVIELTCVAFCHVLFCLLLIVFFKIEPGSIFKNTRLSDCLYGVLVGIGSVSFSILVCTTIIKIIDTLGPDDAPKSIDGWMAVANSGWIRHHKQTIKVIPFYLALLIITLQVGSEEIIFRMVLTHIFMPFGIKIALVSATLLFIYMQTLHMPSKLSAMFPVVGATVMGITHGLLYLENPSIVPLIISHVAFFIFTIL